MDHAGNHGRLHHPGGRLIPPDPTPPPPSVRLLTLATLAAIAAAIVILSLVVLPAEFGIDPTGFGALTGIDGLSEDASSNGASGAATDPGGETPGNVTPPVIIDTYESRFPTTTAQVFTREGYLAEGAGVLIPFTLDASNITKVTLTLAFQDTNTTANGARTRPDTFEVELKAPTGDVSGGVLVRSDANSGGGTGRVAYTVRAPPHPREIDAGSEDEARRAFHANDPADRSHGGEWLARVTLVEAGQGDVQGVPVRADEGNDWTITVTVQSYALDVAVKPGTRQRQDTVTLEIPPGGGLEYKLQMALGGRVEYAWRTDGAVVYVDFHGERTGDESGAFTRHRNGDFTEDAGTLIAPFDGRHGWFWRNTGSDAVRITLETRGQYDVIGRV